MSLSDEYRELATLIDALESKGVAVREAVPVGGDGQDGTASDRFSVRMVVDLPEGTVTRESDDGLANGDRSRQRARDAADAAERTNGEKDAEAASDGDSTGDDTVSDSANAADARTEEAADPETEDAADDKTADAADDKTADTIDDKTADAADDKTADGDADGVDCTHPDCARTFETERGMKIHRTKAHPLSEIINPDATGAVHQDPEALADVYEQYETFAEMTEALNADVGAQAVRKQMIRHGIHEPEGQAPGEGTSGAADIQTLATDADRGGDGPERVTASANGDTRNGTNSKNGVDDSASDDTSGPATDDPDTSGPATDEPDADDAADDPDADNAADDPDADNAADDPDADNAADDPDATDEPDATDHPDAEESVAARLPELDLPGDLTTTELKTAVETANTLYDVQRALDLDSETTRDVLSEYDLLELVSGRAASVRDREELKSEIHERLRRTAA